MAQTIGVCPRANSLYVDELTLALKRKSVVTDFSLDEVALTEEEREIEKDNGNRTSKILKIRQRSSFKGILKFRFSMGPDGNDPGDVPLFSNITISRNDYGTDLAKVHCYKTKNDRTDDLSLFDDTAPNQFKYRRYKPDVLADLVINKINDLLIQ